MFNINDVEIAKCKSINLELCEKVFASEKDIEDWCYQFKIDGHRKLLIKDFDGGCYAYGKHPSIKTNEKENLIFKVGNTVRHICHSLPPGTIVDGELYLPGHHAKDIPTALSDDSDSLCYSAFGLLYYKGKIWEGNILDTMAKLAEMKLPVVPTIRIKDRVANFDSKEIMRQAAEITDYHHIEGVVLKKNSYDTSYKYKKEETYDVVVTGLKMANYGKRGTMHGLIGSLICAAYVNGNKEMDIVCNVSGMTMEERRQFTKNPPIGEVIEVKAQMSSGGGKLRHPRFIRMRPDKVSKECKITL